MPMNLNSPQLDDVQDAIDIVGLIEAAVEIYPSIAETSGISLSAEDVIADIACDRHPQESVARFRRNPLDFIKREEMVEIGPISAGSFAVLVSALDAVASAGHALDVLKGKRV